MKFFERKWAVVSGGSEGIGLAVAQRLASAGAHVLVLSRRREKLEAARQELERRRLRPDQQFEIASVDVTDEEAVRRQLSRVMERHGAPEFLINAAGFARPGYLEDLDTRELRQLMEVNYFGSVHTVKAVLPAMRQARRGHIVNVASMAGYLGLFGYAGYCASKYAVVGFSLALRREVSPFGVSVSVLCPSNTRTPGFEKENRFKPPEVRALEDKASTVDADDVAQALLAALPRRSFMIHPTWNARLIYYAARLLPTAIMDRFMTRPKIKP